MRIVSVHAVSALALCGSSLHLSRGPLKECPCLRAYTAQGNAEAFASEPKPRLCQAATHTKQSSLTQHGVVASGSAKSVLVFDMEGYSDPKTIMPSFMVSHCSVLSLLRCTCVLYKTHMHNDMPMSTCSVACIPRTCCIHSLEARSSLH